MYYIKRKYMHYLNILTKINYTKTDPEYKIHSVYFINTLINKNYVQWLVNQIDMIKNYNSTIYIIAIIKKGNENNFQQIVEKHFPNLNINYEYHYKNEYEYRGILKVWDLGQIYNTSNDIILYFHSKGVSRHSSYAQNKNDNYNIILKDINKIKEIFTLFPMIHKIGYSVGRKGHIWYNFWFARGSYINRVEKPILTSRRHYYEDWVARVIKNNVPQIVNYERDLNNTNIYENTLRNCYGFHRQPNIANIGSFYDPSKNIYLNINRITTPINKTLKPYIANNKLNYMNRGIYLHRLKKLAIRRLRSNIFSNNKLL